MSTVTAAKNVIRNSDPKSPGCSVLSLEVSTALDAAMTQWGTGKRAVMPPHTTHRREAVMGPREQETAWSSVI